MSAVAPRNRTLFYPEGSLWPAGRVPTLATRCPPWTTTSTFYIITDACGDVSSEGMLQIGRRSSICCEPQRDWARTDTAGTTTSVVLSHGGIYGLGVAYAARMLNAADGR
jgi:hypothetical protein